MIGSFLLPLFLVATTLHALQRELLHLSADAGDEGTSALMSDYIRAQEKLVWMYGAYLGK